MVREAIANSFLLGNGQKPSQKPSNLTENDKGKVQKRSDLTISEDKNGHKNGHEDDQKPPKKQPKKQPKLKVPIFPAPSVEEVYKAIKMNCKAKYSWLADNLGVSERTIQRAIDELKELGYINKEHSKIKGEWQLLK